MVEFTTWQDQRERELLKPFIEQHIKTTSALYEIVGKLELEKNQDKQNELAAQFFIIYFGPAKQYLTPESFEALGLVALHVNDCFSQRKRNSTNESVQCSLFAQSLVPFSQQSRMDLSSRLAKNGLEEIANLNPVIPRKLQK
jgi:hypothetical protein